MSLKTSLLPKISPIAKMCRVQRVVNTCGHVNDHVLMTCRVARARSPSPLPAAASGNHSSLNGVPLGTLSTQTPAQVNAAAGASSALGLVMPSLTISQGHAVTPTHQTENSAPNSGTTSQGDSQSIVVGTGQPGLAHASTHPYCTTADIKHLSSAEGFQCMVPGCGRAN